MQNRISIRHLPVKDGFDHAKVSEIVKQADCKLIDNMCHISNLSDVKADLLLKYFRALNFTPEVFRKRNGIFFDITSLPANYIIHPNFDEKTQELIEDVFQHSLTMLPEDFARLDLSHLTLEEHVIIVGELNNFIKLCEIDKMPLWLNNKLTIEAETLRLFYFYCMAKSADTHLDLALERYEHAATTNEIIIIDETDAVSEQSIEMQIDNEVEDAGINARNKAQNNNAVETSVTEDEDIVLVDAAAEETTIAALPTVSSISIFSTINSNTSSPSSADMQLIDDAQPQNEELNNAAIINWCMQP